MRITLPVPPSVNAMYRNVPKVGRVKTGAYKAWQKDAALMVGHHEPITGPVVVSMAIPENGRRDLDNHAKPILDFINKRGLIDSDRCKCVRGISMVWHDEPDVHVTIEKAAI